MYDTEARPFSGRWMLFSMLIFIVTEIVLGIWVGKAAAGVVLCVALMLAVSFLTPHTSSSSA
jgi:hypothetical protein